MILEIERYNSKHKEIWDDFIDKAKNSTFLFKRCFMEYHSDRFDDYSLMVFEKSKLIAVLPANLENDKKITSHAGLTYGGLVIQAEIKLNLYLSALKAILKFLNENNILFLNYKALPVFYANLPAQEEEYAMFLLKAEIYRADTTLVIKYPIIPPFQKRRLRMIKRASSSDIVIKDDNNLKLFWNSILSPHLMNKFQTPPTHSVDEIIDLALKFPDNISHLNVFYKNEIVAGATIFETQNVAHAQYISSNEIGRKSGAVDFLTNYLILNKFKSKEYFDFGICNENEGYVINHGLLDWKEGFGGRTYVHKFYSIDTSNYRLLENVIKD